MPSLPFRKILACANWRRQLASSRRASTNFDSITVYYRQLGNWKRRCDEEIAAISLSAVEPGVCF
jgi:hypothetical protein